MSAEDIKSARVYVEISDVDREDGVRLNASRGTWQYDADLTNGDSEVYLNTVLFGEKTRITTWENVWDLLNTKNSTAKKGKVTDVIVSIYDNKGRWVADYSANDGDDVTTAAVSDGYRIVISTLIDENKAGYAPGAGQDDIDDRHQPIVTVVEQSKPGSSVYLHGTYQFVVNEGDNVAKLVSEGKYDGEFPLYEEVYYDSKEDIDYIFAYEGDLTKVTKDVEVKANYVKDGKDVKRFGATEAEKEYDELDANKDGVVSCEEALGKGWVWNNETSACELKGSSNTGSYVPNTATK